MATARSAELERVDAIHRLARGPPQREPCRRAGNPRAGYVGRWQRVTLVGPLDWVACGFALAGSLLLAVRCRVSAWGWGGFVLCNLAWRVYAIGACSPRLLAPHSGLSGTSVVGI